MRLLAVVPLLLLFACGVPAADLPPAPSATDAPSEVAGPPIHEIRVRPIPVLEGHVYALPVLLENLAADSAVVRARCCLLLGEIGSEDAVPALVTALDDPDRDVRIFAGMALARLGDERGAAAAASALQGPRWWMRHLAVTALGILGTERAIGLLEPALDDPDSLVREAAEYAIDNPGPTDHLDVAYSGPADMSVEDTIFALANYLIAETDWWWHAGDYRQILRANETVRWLDPSWEEGYSLAAYLYWSLGRNTEAIGTYRRGVAVHPDSWHLQWELGFYYFNAQKRYEDAIPQFELARELGSPAVESRMHAHALERAGHPREALEVWHELREQFGEDAVVTMNIDRLRARLQEG